MKNFLITFYISQLKLCLILFTSLSFNSIAQVAILPTDARIQIEGSNYISNDNGELVIHRHSDAVYAGTTLSNLFNPEKARSSSGILILFKTNSPTINVKFRMIEGGNTNPKFAIFQNNVFTQNLNYTFVAGSEISMDLVSEHPGEEVVYKIALPLKRDIHFLGIELENGFDIVSFPEEQKPVYVAYGDSITHGTGQLTTPETYPYLIAEMFGYELFNLAVGGSKTSLVMAEMIRDDFNEIDVMTILIGYNDYNGQGIDAETYRDRYNGVLSAIRNTHPNTKIFCITMTTTTNNNSVVTGIAADDFRAVVIDIVNQRQTNGDTNLFLIHGDAITTEANLRENDAVHFSVEGALDFANELYDEMNAELTLSVESEITPEKSPLIIYPNPATANVFLESTQNIESINMYDTKGHEIECNLINNYLNTKHLASGMYLFQITYANGQQESKKLLVK